MKRTITSIALVVWGLSGFFAVTTAQAVPLSKRNIALPPPPVPSSRDEIDTPFEHCAAYQQLLRDIKDLQHRLKHENFGFAAPEKRREIKQEIKVLQSANQRLIAYYSGTQPGCPLPGVMRGAGGAAPTVSPKDIYCMPRLKLSNRLVNAVRWSEETQFLLKKKSYTFAESEQKKQAERAIAETEKALHKISFPPGLYHPVDRIETVDPVYYSPNSSTKIKK